MTPERWQRLQEVFERALPLDPDERAQVLVKECGDDIALREQVLSLLPGPEVDGLFRDGVLPAGAGDRILDCWSECAHLMNGVGELGGLQFLEVRSTLPDELLMYGDKLSMAHSLEVRVPYLDREVIEYVERLPDSYKVRLGKTKWLHRRICRVEYRLDHVGIGILDVVHQVAPSAIHALFAFRELHLGEQFRRSATDAFSPPRIAGLKRPSVVACAKVIFAKAFAPQAGDARLRAPEIFAAVNVHRDAVGDGELQLQRQVDAADCLHGEAFEARHAIVERHVGFDDP